MPHKSITYSEDFRPPKREYSVKSKKKNPKNEVVLITGVSGVGKGYVLDRLPPQYENAGVNFEEEFKVVSYSGLLLKHTGTNDRDELRYILETPKKALPYLTAVADEVFAMEGRILLDTHAVNWHPEVQMWGDSWPAETRKSYQVAGVALIEPESVMSLEKRRANDSSRDRTGFPNSEEFLFEEKVRAKQTAYNFNCSFTTIINRYNQADVAAHELYDFLETIHTRRI